MAQGGGPMRAAVALWSALVLATATVALAAGYQSAWALPVLALLAVLPVGLVGLGRALALPSWAIATAGVTLGVLPALMIADGVDPAQGGWRSAPAFSLLAPLIDAVPRLLTAPRPAPPDPAHLVPVALVVYLTALVVALLTVGRRTSTTPPLVGAVVLHTAGALLTAGRGDPYGLAVLLTALVLVLGWAWLPGPKLPGPRLGGAAAGQEAPGREADGRTSRPRRLPVLSTAVVAVVATFAGAAVLVGTDRSFEPRTLVPPPALPVAATNPVPDLAAWTARPDQPLFSVAPLGSDQLPPRLMLAALPDFDGAAWRIEARLRGLGVVEEPDLPAGEHRTEASYLVQPEGLEGVWLPATGQVESVDADVLVDVHTGMVVLPDGLGADPITVRTQWEQAQPSALTRAGVPPVSTAGRYLHLPRVPGQLRQEALDTVEGLESRWDQALALQEAVRGERLLDHQAPSGSSYGRIQEFLFLDSEEGGQVGSTEQFAAAFAVLARAAGLPTRLVVGFDLTEHVQGGGTEPVMVHGADARAWAEVYFARVGWVAFDPSPDVSTEVERPEDTQESEEADPTPAPSSEPDEGQAGEDQPATQPEQAATTWLGAAAVITVVVVLVIALLAVLVTAGSAVRARLRWRRRGALGAWALIQRSLRVAGRRPPAQHSAPDVAAALGEPVRRAATMVAEQAEYAAFAPPEAGAGGSTTGLMLAPGETQAGLDGPPGNDGAGYTEAQTGPWVLATEVERYLRRQAPWWRRLGWWIWPG